MQQNMSLTLHMHPLASYCWKVLIALYENETPFEKQIVNLADGAERAGFRKLWPIGKFPVLRDSAADRVIPESSNIIEYLAEFFPGKIALLPLAADAAREARLRDRVYDLYVHEPMQKIVTDKLRPEGKSDPYGVELARTLLTTSYTMLDREFMSKTWAAGEAFTLADCAAAPALYYANLVQPFIAPFPNLGAYMKRLLERPSFVRVLTEAEPYFAQFPG